MAIITHILPENRIALFCLKDRVTLLDIADAIFSVTGHQRWTPHFNYLWYRLPGMVLAFDPEHLKHFEAATAGLNHMAQGVRIAIATTPDDVDIPSILTAKDHMRIKSELRIFLSLEEGTDWLGVSLEAIREYLV